MESTDKRMLPPEAKIHFDKLWGRLSADASAELAERVRKFDLQEGSQIGGSGYAARFGKLLALELRARTRALRNTLFAVHADFEAPLGPGVEDALIDWGARALSSAQEGLESYFIRHLGGYGVGPIYSSGLEYEFALSQVAVLNGARDRIWTLRNVPMKKPKSSDSTSGGGITINGPVGGIFSGPNASPTISQTWSTGELPVLQVALGRLAKAIEDSSEVARADKVGWTASIDTALKEIEAPEPNTSRLRTIFGGLATGVQALGSVKPAWEIVQEA